MPHLDALRGVAALIVVVSHSANAGLLPSFLGVGFGQMGVGLFYVLSAFLLTSLYSEKKPDNSAIWDYLIRRIARVLPLFYAALIASLLLESVTGMSAYGAFDTLLIALNNIFIIHGTSVLWSIPVEIHFYIVFILFWRFMHINVRLAFAFIISLQLILGAIALILDFHIQSLPFWMHFFTFGCFLAVIFRMSHFSNRISSSITIKVFTLLVIISTPLLLPALRNSVFGFERLPTFIDPISLLWVAAVSIAFIFSFIPSNWTNNSFFRWLGELSFGVYIIHMAVIKFVNFLNFEGYLSNFIGFIIVVIATYAIAATVNKYFERPAQKFILKLRKPNS